MKKLNWLNLYIFHLIHKYGRKLRNIFIKYNKKFIILLMKHKIMNYNRKSKKI